MKRYMVQSRFIGTLLDIYYDKNTNNKHYHRDLSHLATYDLVCNGDNDSNRDSSNRNISPEDIEEKGEKNVDFSFALSIMKKQKQQDDLVVESKEKSKKKRESDEEDHPSYGITKPYKENDEKRFPFIIRTISSLICSCKFLLSGRYIAEDSLFLNVGEANNILEIEERVISLICSDEVINELVIRSNMLFSTREAVHVMYSHLMWNNLDVSNKIMEILIAEICNKESTFSDVIKQTPFLVEISKINDELSPERMEKLIKNIYEDTFMEEYKTSIKYSDSMLSLILQVIRRNYDACKYMRELDDPLKPIEKFTIEHPIPKVTSSKQVLFKNLSDDKIDKQFSEADKNMLREYGEYRLAQFKDLLVDLDWEDHIKTFVRKEGEQYIDPDIVYIPGQKVDYFKEEYKHWIDAEVIEDYGPALQVSYRVPEIIMNIERLQSYKPAVKIVKDSVRPHEVFTTDLYQKSNGLYLYLYEKAIDKKQRGIRNIHR